jgi:hypothetical protein
MLTGELSRDSGTGLGREESECGGPSGGTRLGVRTSGEGMAGGATRGALASTAGHQRSAADGEATSVDVASGSTVDESTEAETPIGPVTRIKTSP